MWMLLLGVIFLCAGLLMAGATFVFMTHQTPVSESATILGHRNDTILLKGGIDASNVTVRQCVARGDDYHDTNIYLINNKEIELKRVRSFHQYQWHYQESSSYKSAIQDYLYLLPDSSFTYRICSASSTSYDQSAMYLLFDDDTKYRNYVNDQENGESYSIFSQPLLAGQNNHTVCTEISQNIVHPSYYFMMVRSPAGNISYSYNFTLEKVAYNTTDAKQYCNVEISLRSDNFKHYSIIAYIQPSEFENSIVTHFCVSTYAGSATLTKFSYISDAMFGVGGALLMIAAVLLIYMLASQCHKHEHHDEERQNSLIC